MRSKQPQDRKCRPGAVFGLTRVIELTNDGKNKVERCWLVECVKCGSRRTRRECDIIASEHYDGARCKLCPQLPSVRNFDPRTNAIEVRTEDGRALVGELRER